MVRSAASGHPPVFLQQDGLQVASGEASHGAYQRAAGSYGGALQQQQQPQHFGAGGASDSAAGFGGEMATEALGDPRQAVGGAHLGQGGGGGYDQVMRVAGQDLPGYSGRWQDDDGGADNQFQLATAGARPSLSEVDWYDPRTAEQQALAHRQTLQLQMLSGGYDYGVVPAEAGTGMDALPYQTSSWI